MAFISLRQHSPTHGKAGHRVVNFVFPSQSLPSLFSESIRRYLERLSNCTKPVIEHHFAQGALWELYFSERFVQPDLGTVCGTKDVTNCHCLLAGLKSSSWQGGIVEAMSVLTYSILRKNIVFLAVLFLKTPASYISEDFQYIWNNSAQMEIHITSIFCLRERWKTTALFSLNL